MYIIPLDFIKLHDGGSHVKISIEINGVAAELILDTGASMTVFDRKKLSELDKTILIQDSEQLTTGIGTNSMQTYRATIGLLKIGQLSIRNYESALLDLSYINEAYFRLSHKPVIGVLGNDILVRYGAVINYQSEQLLMNDIPLSERIKKKISRLLRGG